MTQGTERSDHSADPTNVVTKLQEALSFLRRGNLDDAEASYRMVLAQSPNHFDALHMLGVISFQKGQFAAALELIQRAIAINSNVAVAHFNHGLLLHVLRRLDEAIASYDLAVKAKPDYMEAFVNRGMALADLKRLVEALASYDRALEIKPDSAEVLYNRGIALSGLKRQEDALLSYVRALTIKPEYAEAHNNRANVLRELKRFDEALASYDRAVAVKPDYADALNNRGSVLRDLKRFEEAVASYDRALMVKPDNPEVLNYRGNALRDRKRFDEALASYDRALAIKPDYAEALNYRGNALQDLKRFDEALASYDRALAIKPDYAEVYNNRGTLLKNMGRLAEALANYDRALAIKPSAADVLINRGTVLTDLKRFDEAFISLDRALVIEPDNAFLSSLRVLAKLNICDWRDLDDDLSRLAALIVPGRKAAEPFPVLATSFSPAVLKKCAEIHIQQNHPPNSLFPEFKVKSRHDRVRLAYFSTDFNCHPIGYLTAKLFETHDRSRFEVIGLSLGPGMKDAMRGRLEKAFDRFFDIDPMPDQDVALLCRKLEIDIAIDLTGYTGGCRTDIFAMRVAPIQVNYLGYAGTMGAPYIDYLLADRTLIPEEEQRYYAEKIVYLPDTFMPSDSTRPIAPKVFSRTECGLPDKGFVFCCFNNSYKLTPRMFDIWMRLLRNVQGSVLWLLTTNNRAKHNLSEAAKARSVDPKRIVFTSFVPDPADYLARLKLADLFLDTLPYNAHATANDALWAGVPVLTCLGTTFPGRVAASLLKAVGLPELITHDLYEYEALASDLATDTAKLWSVKQKLAANRLTHPLFDSGLFTRHIESAYLAMWTRFHEGRAPASLYISA